MKQRKRAQREPSETLTQELTVEIGDDGERKGFYACYLLVSLSPRHKGHTYIGFTVNPRRRIRQHNGEIGCGAWRTKKRRPWEMVLCIHGFPSNVSALQFEWAWQHPNESLAVRKAAASFKSLSGIANKIKLAYTMLTLPSWQSLNITVNYFSTKYTQHSAGCLSLPQHKKVKICPMDELPCYVKGDEGLFENEGEWDNEERDEAGSGSESAEETLSNSMFGNTEEHDKNGLGKLYGWITEGEDCREQSTFAELPARPSLNVSSSGSLAGEFTDDTGISGLFKDESFKSKRPAKDPSKSLVTIDDDQPPSSHIVPSEVEIIDVTTPSPLCRSSLWGNKANKRARNKEPHNAPGEVEVVDLTTPSPLCR
ncbi:uncharacterized protein LOC112095210, partial [Morus notabilis]|uniref:uncharacterized protein LOC112095210 n=1 Tax=Morus notabilis TaxID=981085 RepID=UPI000CECF5A4